MDTFALVLPAGAVAVSLLQVFVFVLMVAIIPGSIGVTLLSYIGGGKQGDGHVTFSTKKFLRKLLDIVLYHAAMVVVWMITWPQFYNNVHSGYSWNGLPQYLGIMVLWTALGIYMIYGYKFVVDGQLSYRPTIGLFVRMFFWNLAIKFLFRNLIYFFVTTY